MGSSGANVPCKSYSLTPLGTSVSAPLFDRTLEAARILRTAAAFARRRALNLASMMGTGGIVARRYVGAPGATGEAALSLLFLGREQFAREFEVYFRTTNDCAIEPCDIPFRGSLAQYAAQKERLAREASDVDLVACEDFPGAVSHEEDVLHFPMLSGRLRVEQTLEGQIRRVRSRSQRKLARELLRRDDFVAWTDSHTAALERFHRTLYSPYVLERFGVWGKLDGYEDLRRVYALQGRILFVARRSRPTQPVCGTLLYDAGGGTLAYHVNGFAESCHDGRLMAEHTAALELALVRHAIEHRFRQIDLGYTRAILNDGLFVHKRRLGCSFVPSPNSPRFRLRVRRDRRAAIFARHPLLTGQPGAWTALLGFDGTGQRCSKQAWRATLKSYRVPGLTNALVWILGKSAGASGTTEAAFRDAVLETLDLPEGVEFRET